MSSTSELLSYAATAVKSAVKAGAEQAEAYSSSTRSIRVDVSGRQIHDVKSIHDEGLGVRAYSKNGMGFAYTMQLTRRSAKEAATKAARLARLAQPDPHFESLPRARKPTRVGGLYDRRLAGATVSEVSALAEELIESALDVSRDIILRGGIDVVSGSYAVLNSLGVRFGERTSSVFGYVMSIIKKTAEDVGSGAEFDVARKLKDFKPDWIGEEATKKASKFLGAVQSKTRRCTLLLSPNATMDFVYALGSLANSLHVMHDRSCLGGKEGTKITSEEFTLLNDGRAQEGAMSSSVDAEGSPRKRFSIVRNGVLKTYLHNSYTARRMKARNNACATRGSYRSPISVGPSNLQVKRGSRGVSDIIEEIDDGIYVDSFPPPDAVTGNISSMIDFGIHIRKGELDRAIKGTMVGSNFLDILRKMDAVSKEVRVEPGIVTPYLRIVDAQIAGK